MMNHSENKFRKYLMNIGFTLIELLIVVAIIGILAAVGAAVIPGLLKNAKINATKQNLSTVMNYIPAQLIKCDLGATQIMDNHLNCIDKSNARKVSVAVSKAFDGIISNPYNTPGAGEGIIYGSFNGGWEPDICNNVWSNGRIAIQDHGIAGVIEISVCTGFNEKKIKHLIRLE